MSMLQLLTVIFITLKLIDKIDWSWWIVFSPFIAQIVLVAIIGGVIAVRKG